MNKLNKLGFLALFFLLNFSMLQAQITINELDADTPGTDAAEFVELTGPANTPLDGYVFVLFNGSNNSVYECHDLDGYAIDANGFFVIGNLPAANLGPAQDATINATNWLQNGADGVALYQVADCASIPACPTGTTNLTDAMVYGTNDADATTLLSCLGETVQYNESGGGAPADESSQWDGTTYVTNTPTPGVANNTTVLCSISNAFISNAMCTGLNGDYVFDVTFTEAGSSGTFKIVDVTDTGNPVDLVTGLTATTTTITLTANISTTPINLVVQDEADATCASNTLTITPADCSFSPSCAAVGELVITEIMHSPNGVNDLNGEYFEVYNPTANPIDMQGYELDDLTSSTPHTIASTVIVPAMGYAVLALDGDMAANGGFTADYVYSGFTLSSSDMVKISCGGAVIDSVDYSIGGYPAATSASLTLNMGILDATMNDDPANWCAASTTTLTSSDFGTPGTANPACPSCTLNVGDLIVTEIMHDPNPPIGANEGEYFEVYNTTAADIDMIGLVIRDDGSNNHTIISSVIVPAMGYTVLGKNTDMTTNGGIVVNYSYGSSWALGDPDAIVIECFGTEIDRVEYDANNVWPSGSNGTAMSLDPLSLDATSNDDGANWCNATTMTGLFMGTPGAANDSCTPPCAITDVTVTGACNGVDYEYTVAFTVVSGGGTYEVVDNTTMAVLATTTTTSATITIAASVATTPFDIVVRDMTDVACVSTAVTVTPEDCSAPACPTDLTLTTAEVGSMTYQVSNNITSTDAIASGEVVVYDAGNCIELPADFEVIMGAEFDAIIGGCTALTGQADNK